MIQQTEAAREAIFEKAGIIRNSGRKYMALHGTYLSNSGDEEQFWYAVASNPKCNLKSTLKFILGFADGCY